MSATDTIKEEMSLDEKLAAIDAAMAAAQEVANETAKAAGRVIAPIDPADATMCIGCQ